MPQPIPQRIITVSLQQIDTNLRAFYTYLSPITGSSYINSPSCDIECSQPTYTLFVLDFGSSQAGWTIAEICARKPSKSLAHQIGPSSQSVQVYNPHIDDTTEYAFYIIYIDPVTGEPIPIDPQEGNIPRIYGEPD